MIPSTVIPTEGYSTHLKKDDSTEQVENIINIISELILEYYSSSKRYVKDLISEISKQDPLKIKSDDLYKSKIVTS